MSNTYTLYGISNCDTVSKARKWLDNRQINYRFHDFRKDGLDREQVAEWLKHLGWETLINRRSTSWRALDESIRSKLDDDSALDIILQQPTLIKRPLLSTGDALYLGFKDAEYQTVFAG